jgi:putative FmdB family regulatory protein
MPLYEYECKTCDQTVEVLVRSSSEKPACPTCGEVELEKVFSVPSSPSIRDGASLPVSAGESCGAPRCCGGGCNF